MNSMSKNHSEHQKVSLWPKFWFNSEKFLQKKNSQDYSHTNMQTLNHTLLHSVIKERFTLQFIQYEDP